MSCALSVSLFSNYHVLSFLCGQWTSSFVWQLKWAELHSLLLKIVMPISEVPFTLCNLRVLGMTFVWLQVKQSEDLRICFRRETLETILLTNHLKRAFWSSYLILVKMPMSHIRVAGSILSSGSQRQFLPVQSGGDGRWRLTCLGACAPCRSGLSC